MVSSLFNNNYVSLKKRIVRFVMVKIKLDAKSIQRDAKKKKIVTVVAQEIYSKVRWGFVFTEIEVIEFWILYTFLQVTFMYRV